MKKLSCYRHRDQGSRLGESLFGAAAFDKFIIYDLAKFRVDLRLVTPMTNATDEEIGTIADVHVIGLVPLHKFEVTGFHRLTSRIA